MQEIGNVVIDGKIIKYSGNNYPANRIDSIIIDNNQKIKTSIASMLLWIFGVFYIIDFYQNRQFFSFEVGLLCIIFAVIACFFALSKKTFVKMVVSKKTIMIKAPNKAVAVKICEAVAQEISASSN